MAKKTKRASSMKRGSSMNRSSSMKRGSSMGRSSSMKRAPAAKRGATKRTARKSWTSSDVRELRGHSRSKTPVSKISKMMKRTVGALRQKALGLGLPLGHRR